MDARSLTTFCVAVDGSNVSYAAMRLALTLMRPTDSILVVTILEPGATLDVNTLLKNAQVEALKMHTVTMAQVRAEAVALKDGQKVLDVLTRLANHKCKTFVVGASGKGYESKGKPRIVGAALPLGTTAEHLLYHCKAPLILVRADQTGKFKAVDPNAFGHHRPDLKIGVAVDGSKIAQRAFDRALGFARKPDVVEAFHVHDGSSSRRLEPEYQLKHLQALYESECNKAESLKRVRACSFTPMLKHGGESAQACIAAHVEKAQYDLLVLGSIELADMSKNIHLGSVAAACAKGTSCNICVVKNFVSYQ